MRIPGVEIEYGVFYGKPGHRLVNNTGRTVAYHAFLDGSNSGYFKIGKGQDYPRRCSIWINDMDFDRGLDGNYFRSLQVWDALGMAEGLARELER